MKREWVYAPYIQTFFWDYRNTKKMSWKDQEEALLSDSEFATWCAENNCKIQHSWVECPNDETAMLFTIRWVE